MLRQIFVLSFMAAILASVVLIFRRPMSLLAKIQIALTVFVIVAFVANMKMALWLHSMAYDDPVRQEWQPRLDKIGDILWFGAIIPWLLFTIYHVIVRARQKPSV